MCYGELISTNVDRKPEVALLSCQDEVSEGMKWACRLSKVDFVLASVGAAFPIELRLAMLNSNERQVLRKRYLEVYVIRKLYDLNLSLMEEVLDKGEEQFWSQPHLRKLLH